MITIYAPPLSANNLQTTPTSPVLNPSRRRTPSFRNTYFLSQFSEYNLNFNKCELFPIHKEALEVNPSAPIKIEKHNQKYLGVLITREFKEICN